MFPYFLTITPLKSLYNGFGIKNGYKHTIMQAIYVTYREIIHQIIGYELTDIDFAISTRQYMF